MTDWYDENQFSNSCRYCESENSFYREKEIIDREILNIGDGLIDVDDSDLHPQTDWVYFCDKCGRSNDDLEDLLAEIDEDEEDDE